MFPTCLLLASWDFNFNCASESSTRDSDGDCRIQTEDKDLADLAECYTGVKSK